MGRNYQPTDLLNSRVIDESSQPNLFSDAYLSSAAAAPVDALGSSQPQRSLDTSSAGHNAYLSSGQQKRFEQSSGEDLGPLAVASALGGAGALYGGQYAWKKWLKPERALTAGTVIDSNSGRVFSDPSLPDTFKSVKFAGRDGLLSSFSYDGFRGADHATPDNWRSLSYYANEPASYIVTVHPDEGNEISIGKTSGTLERGRAEVARVSADGNLLHGDPSLVRSAAKNISYGVSDSEHLVDPDLNKALDVLKVFTET